MLKRTLSLFAVISFFLVFALETKAGMGPPGPPMGPPACWPPPCAVPIDGGISLLIVAGLALGGKKFYDYKKKV